jgi:XXXCH domain-containing protein
MNHSPKVLKKDIKRLWKTLSKAIESGALPDQSIFDELTKKCEDYNMFTEREWSDQWKYCCDKIKQCYTTAHDDDFEEASKLIKEIKKFKKECHSKFKK